MSKKNKKRILLKLSGEILSGDHVFGIDPNVAQQLAKEVASLKKLDIPTLLICGNASKLRSGASPYEEQQGLIKLMSNGHAAILKDHTHAAPLINPELYAFSILSFLNNLKQS